MNIRGWWERMRGARRQRLLAKRRRPARKSLSGPPRQVPRPGTRPIDDPFDDRDDPIEARVDLVRFAAFAEAAVESMQAGPPSAARARYDEACLFFGRAIEAASRAGLAQEVARLKTRRTSLRRLFDAIRKTELRNQKPDIRKPETRAPKDH